MTKLAVVALCALLSVCVAVDKHHVTNLRSKSADEPAATGMVATMNSAKHAHTGPAVVDKRFCAALLVGIEKKEAPYWDSESADEEGHCTEDRPELLAQCDKKIVGFLSKVAQHCPSIDPPAPGDDFKKVEYVGDIATAATASQHKKPPVPIKDECDDCEDEAEEEVALKRTTKVGADGKPMPDKAFEASPLAPSAKVDAHQADGECDDQPCDEDHKTMTPPPCVTENGSTPGPCTSPEDETAEGE